MAPTFTDVYGEKYLLLTTFTKDGRPKPTPVQERSDPGSVPGGQEQGRSYRGIERGRLGTVAPGRALAMHG